jgi:butyryl-CoA dehydrogenase
MRKCVAAEDAEWKRTLLARAFADLSAARVLVARAAEAKDAGAPYVIEASVAKLVASGAAVRIAAAGVDVAGPAGVRAEAPAQRLLRDARVFPIVEGTTEIQELILARTLLPPRTGPNPL